MKQLALLKNQPSAYGGELLKTRKGRARPRPLSTRESMHLVLRSSKAKGPWSFRRRENAEKVRRIALKFSRQYGVKILSMANVGNHLHFHIKLSNRFTYRPFIRALTAAIAMAITGANRWNPLKREPGQAKERFWDYRPFTRVIQGLRALLTLKDYIRINQYEGHGFKRDEAEFLVFWQNGGVKWAEEPC